MSRKPVDFKALKNVTFEQAAAFLNLSLYKQEGQEFRYRCPRCSSDKDGNTHKRGLAIHPDKGFTCHISGKKGTDAVALVAHCENVSQYDAGVMLEEQFLHSSPSQSRKAKAEDRREPMHPVAEMLGLSADLMEAIGVSYSDTEERLLIPLRAQDGRSIGNLGIATRADQKPLLQFPEGVEPINQSPEDLRALFRVV